MTSACLGLEGIRRVADDDCRIPTLSEKYPTVNLGVASVPVSLYELIQRTPVSLHLSDSFISRSKHRTPFQEETTPELFAVERSFFSSFATHRHFELTLFRTGAWTSEIRADVSVILTGFRDKSGDKIRQIALVVAHGLGGRLNEKYADSLFLTLKNAIEDADVFKGELKRWKRPDGKKLLPRRAVWEHQAKAGRKIVRPIVEKAVREWAGKKVPKRVDL